MSDPVYIPAWQRPLWQPSEEEILLQFYVFGKFESVRVPSEGYGSKGLPEGMELTSHHHAALRQWEGYPLKGSLGKMLKQDVPEIYQAALATPEVLVVRGQFKDSPATGYLRDTLGVLSGLLEIGGKAILDPQIMSLFDAAAWRRRYLIKDGAPIRNHVLILRDDEESEGRCWIHTRGMRKFGRPDLSFRNVPDREAERAGSMCEQLVEVQAMGGHFEQGQQVDVGGLPGGLQAHLIGDYAHPDFNNTAVEFRWPV